LDVRSKWLERKTFYIALYTEIKLNTDEIRNRVAGFPSQDEFNTFLAKGPNYRPFIVCNYISGIYDSNLPLLQKLPDILIRKIIAFYGALEFIVVLSQSFELKSFETISQKGREVAVARFLEATKAAAQDGANLLDHVRRELRIPDVNA
jgi:hypothetical protein